MQRRQRRIALQALEHALIKENRPIVFGAAMDNAMTYGDKVEALLLAQPTRRLLDCGSNIWYGLTRVLSIDEDGLAIPFGPQPRPCTNAVHLALDQTSELRDVIYSEYLKLYARGARID